jgi:hypothetical protein
MLLNRWAMASAVTGPSIEHEKSQVPVSPRLRSLSVKENGIATRVLDINPPASHLFNGRCATWVIV